MEKTVNSVEELRAILASIAFAPSCVDMGWEWEVRSVVSGSKLVHYIDVGDMAPGDVVAYIEKQRDLLKDMRPEMMYIAYRGTEPPVFDSAGWLVSTTFQRPDRDSGVVGRGKGREWFIGVGTSESGVVKTAWLAAKQIVEHELMEAFRYQGKRVFDPHRTVEQLCNPHWPASQPFDAT
jgi:hypothetical protein